MSQGRAGEIRNEGVREGRGPLYFFARIYTHRPRAVTGTRTEEHFEEEPVQQPSTKAAAQDDRGQSQAVWQSTSQPKQLKKTVTPIKLTKPLFNNVGCLFLRHKPQ